MNISNTKGTWIEDRRPISVEHAMLDAIQGIHVSRLVIHPLKVTENESRGSLGMSHDIGYLHSYTLGDPMKKTFDRASGWQFFRMEMTGIDFSWKERIGNA